MRGVEAHLVVSRPDDLVGDQLDVREGARRVIGVVDDLGRAKLQAVVVVDPRGVVVGVADVLDIAVLPDAVGDAHDVVDDVAVGLLEACERLPGTEVLRNPRLLGRPAARIPSEGYLVVRRHVPARQGDGLARTGVVWFKRHRKSSASELQVMPPLRANFGTGNAADKITRWVFGARAIRAGCESSTWPTSRMVVP